MIQVAIERAGPNGVAPPTQPQKTMREKISGQIRTDGRGVSPVIGVILMVAITVILAAVIGTFVMGIGGDVSQNAQAGLSFSETDDGVVTITLNSASRVDALYVRNSSGDTFTWTDSSPNVGDTFTVNEWNTENESITVIGEYNGNNATVGSFP